MKESPSLFGIQFNVLTYTSTLFPAIISTYILSKIEDPIYNFFPAIIRSIFGPFVCIVALAIGNVFVLLLSDIILDHSLCSLFYGFRKLPALSQ